MRGGVGGGVRGPGEGSRMIGRGKDKGEVRTG